MIIKIRKLSRESQAMYHGETDSTLNSRMLIRKKGRKEGRQGGRKKREKKKERNPQKYTTYSRVGMICYLNVKFSATNDEMFKEI